MELRHAAFIILICLGLLSGCAYMEGRKDQQTTPSVNTKTGRVIQPQGSASPAQNTRPNPSQTASKMIAPIIQ